jgi:outer membrane protein assembly factor BamA
LDLDVSGNVFYSSNYLLGAGADIQDQEAVEQIISSILVKYNDAGFPFCKISPTVFRDDNQTSRIVLNITEGPRVVIEDVFIKTAGRTDVGAARRVANFAPGDYFSLKDVNSAKKRLMKTKAFKEITDHILDRDRRYYLLFSLEEKQSDFLSLSGSLSDEDFELGASYSSLSLLGTLRQLSFEYEYQRLFSLKFSEPVLISPAVFDTDFSIWTFDSTRQIQGRARFSAPVGRYFNASVMSGIEIVNYFGTDTLVSETSDNLLGAGLGFDYEMPNWITQHTLEVGYLFRDADRLRIEYGSQTELWQFVIRMNYHYVRTDSFLFFDYSRIGGADDLRGYLEDEFLARRAFWFNIEYHRLPVFPLLDIARIDGETLYSFGLGLEARSRFADASLILAWPGRGNWNDGKLHLLFSKGF